MGILSNIFGRSSNREQERGWRVGGTEDSMTLIRIYFQAVMAANFGLRDRMISSEKLMAASNVAVKTSMRCKPICSSFRGLVKNL